MKMARLTLSDPAQGLFDCECYEDGRLFCRRDFGPYYKGEPKAIPGPWMQLSRAWYAVAPDVRAHLTCQDHSAVEMMVSIKAALSKVGVDYSIHRR